MLPRNKLETNFVYCLFFIVSLTGNTVIGIIVYKTKTMRKPINFFIANMAMCDLLFPFFVIPSLLLMLYTDVWMIGGSLACTRMALCKLKAFLLSAVDIHFWIHFSCDLIGPDQTKTKQGWPRETGTNQIATRKFFSWRPY